MKNPGKAGDEIWNTRSQGGEWFWLIDPEFPLKGSVSTVGLPSLTPPGI